MLKTYAYPEFPYVQSKEQRTGVRKRHPVVVIGAVFAVLLVWGVWAMRTAYVGWAEQRISQRQFLGVVVRFVALYLVLTFFLLS